jgi:polar amino acid transport system substrate-binding protein
MFHTEIVRIELGDIMAKWVLAAILGLLFECAGAAEITAAFGIDKPPFSFRDDNGVDTGIEVDIVRAALKEAGHTLRVRIVPNARLPLLVKAGDADLAATVMGEDGGGLYFSDPYIVFENYAISKRARNVVVNSIADLGKYSFVIWQNGWRDLGPEFETAYRPDAQSRMRPNYNETNSQALQNKMFWADRVDLIIVDRTIFGWYRRELTSWIKTDDSLVFHDIFKTVTRFPVAFHDKKLRDQFNAGLKKIRADGTYQKIYDKYK